MAQGVLGFKYEEEKQGTGMTGLAGLPVYLYLMKVMGLSELIGRHLQVKQRGWTAPGAVREVGGGAFGDEGGLCGRQVAVGGFWGERRLVVDHDFGDEPQYDHEASCFGRFLGISAHEGDSVFVHQHSRPNR